MNRIIVDSGLAYTRAAFVEDGELTELIIEDKNDESLVGNIYAGRVETVVKGLGAAFINIGENKNGILYLDGTALKPGDTVIVQAEKEPINEKGAVLTSKISFPGRFCVLIPGDKGIGVSKKIASAEERARIKNEISKILPEGYGIIARTGAQGKTAEDFEKEVNLLYGTAEKMLEKADFIKPPALIYKKMSPSDKMILELLGSGIDEIAINSRELYDHISAIVEFYGDERVKTVFYDDPVPIFDNYMIESKSEKIFDKKVWLKSGGFLIIERTEAMNVIDVNTGKFAGSRKFENTALKTNIEAALEIARQIRLRNLSGIIIIDFIDMKSYEDRAELIRVMENAVKKDRVKTYVHGITSLGLMELTRKKTVNSNSSVIGKICPSCRGNGYVPSIDYTCEKIRREIGVIFASTVFDEVTVLSNKKMLSSLAGEGNRYIKELEDRYKKHIVLNEIETAALNYYEIQRKKTR